MIERNLAPVLLRAAQDFPVVTLTGPRQSGKTTLCRSVFPTKAYVSLEPLDVRDRVRADPRSFLDQHSAGAIVDEVQHVPELLSYLQVEVDERPEHGRFVLTGSQHFGLTAAIAQSLAGRTAVLHLLPPSLDELRRFGSGERDLFTTLWMGAYPRIHDRGIPADRWLADYVTTYVQRDVRQVQNIGDLTAFTSFLRLAAGRSGQELNLSTLGSDAGVSHNTAKSWLSVLETGYLCIQLPAWLRNLRKQVVKARKLHFLDSGLLCHLLGIRSPDELHAHPLRGAVFESWVVAELYKARTNLGLTADLYHFRESRGLEVDLVWESATQVLLCEMKSGATVMTDALSNLERITALARATQTHKEVVPVLVHGGSDEYVSRGIRVLPWSRVPAWTTELWPQR